MEADASDDSNIDFNTDSGKNSEQVSDDRLNY